MVLDFHEFKEELTGPEYAQRFMDQLFELNIEYKLDTMVLGISENKIVQAINSIDGYMIIEAKSIILTMGCRERTRGAIAIQEIDQQVFLQQELLKDISIWKDIWLVKELLF